MFKYFSALSTTLCTAATVTLFFGMLGFGVTGDVGMLNPNSWMPWFQAFVGISSAVTAFISFFVVLDKHEEGDRNLSKANMWQKRANTYKSELDRNGIRVAANDPCWW